MADLEDNVSMKDGNESDVSSDEKEYEVEEIRDHSITKQGRKFVTSYLIKWLGYDDDENSWESEKNIYALDMIDNYWNAKDDQDPDKSLYYKIHKKKLPKKSKATTTTTTTTTTTAAAASLSSTSTNNQSVLQVERKKIEREAQSSSSHSTPEPREKESTSQQFLISDMFHRTKPTSRKGKKREISIATKQQQQQSASNEQLQQPQQPQQLRQQSDKEDEEDQRKTRGTTKKPNYKDYYDDSDLMDVDDQSDNRSEPEEVIDDPEYNKQYNDWQSLAQEVCYIGQEFQGAPLYCVVKWKTGEKSLHPCNDVKNKCPKLLCEAFIKDYTKQANAETEVIDVED